MTWQDVLVQLGDRADARIRALWQAHEQGRIGRDEFVDLAAVLIAQHRNRAVSAADVAVAVEIARQMGQPVTPVGLAAADDTDRLSRSVTTVLADDVEFDGDDLTRSRSDRLARLSRAETLKAGVVATQAAWLLQGPSDGWRRQTDRDPCPICVNWADGVVRPWTIRMARHTNCACIPVSAPLSRPPRQQRDLQGLMADLEADLSRPSDKTLDEVLADIGAAGLTLV